VAGIPLHELSQTAQTAWSRLRDRLLSAMGNDVVAMWAHGGTTSLDGPARDGDLDTHVVLSRRPDQETARRLPRIGGRMPYPAGPDTERLG
jgi:hypothetical protein